MILFLDEERYGVQSQPRMKRRQFCFRSAAFTALVGLTPWAVEAKPWVRKYRDVSIGELSFERLVSQLRTTFQVRVGEHQLHPLKLVKIDVREPSPLDDPNALDAEFERFTLVFAGSRGERLPQENYHFEHPQIGRFEMFIVPVTSIDSKWQKYEAVFNRPSVT